MTIANSNSEERPSVFERVQAKPDRDEFLTVPLRLRVSETDITDLDRVEAFFRGEGYRHANRSHLVRMAIRHLVEELYGEYPEINTPTTQEEVLRLNSIE